MSHAQISRVKNLRLIDEKNKIKRCLYYGMCESIKFNCDCKENQDHMITRYMVSSSQNMCRNRFELWCAQSLPYFFTQTLVVELNEFDWQQVSTHLIGRAAI